MRLLQRILRCCLKISIFGLGIKDCISPEDQCWLTPMPRRRSWKCIPVVLYIIATPLAENQPGSLMEGRTLVSTLLGGPQKPKNTQTSQTTAVSTSKE
jgi:hypothetical protein